MIGLNRIRAVRGGRGATQSDHSPEGNRFSDGGRVEVLVAPETAAANLLRARDGRVPRARTDAPPRVGQLASSLENTCCTSSCSSSPSCNRSIAVAPAALTGTVLVGM